MYSKLSGGGDSDHDRKARMISDLMCYGLGAALGIVPEGAISVIERRQNL